VPGLLRRLVLRSVAAVLACIPAASVGACYPHECDDWLDCEPPPPPCVADPALAPAEDRCGVFVSSSAGKDDGLGTRAQPVQSIKQAISLAQAGAKRVYACAEVFVEPVVLPAGVELWGGLDCEKGWSYLGGDRKTAIAPGPNEIPLRLEAGGGRSVVADVRAEAADATVPSGSSIATMAMPGAAVEILRSELLAGDGARGTSGRDGGSGPAAPGAPGMNGGNACSADVVPGGEAVTTDCGAVASVGGPGGHGNIGFGGGGQNGEPVPVPNSSGDGQGGVGQSTSALACGVGAVGAVGLQGAHGKGGRGAGRLTVTGWEGEPGQDGGDGLPGQGGGGGGASLGSAVACGSGQPRGGAGGGSGGAGGCGGKGGKGGGYGGASIGLLSLGNSVAVRNTTIVSGDGGTGGNGGLYQYGGLGGSGGLGGGNFNMAAPGCSGGPGGVGGSGGNGGGGAGGPSIGIAQVVGQPVTQEAVNIQPGSPGHGGLNANPNVPGSTGEDGIRAETLTFPQ